MKRCIMNLISLTVIHNHIYNKHFFNHFNVNIFNFFFFYNSLIKHSEDPMIGGITLQGESYSGANTSSNVQNQNITGESSQATGSTKNDWAVQKTQKNENILKFNTAYVFLNYCFLM